MKSISIPLSVSLMIVTLILGMGFGYYVTPEYQSSKYETMGNNGEMLGEADRNLDLRYINSMISHHRAAMLVAEQAEASTRPEIQKLVNDIKTNEPKLIDDLYEWKREWYGDTRLVRDPVVPYLGSYDSSFDLRLLNVLIAHHEEGIEMTKEVRLKTSRTEIIDNADAVEAFLTSTLKEFGGWRSEWYTL